MVGSTQVDLEARERTALHYAADNGYLTVVQYSCERGTDKEVWDAFSGWT